MCNASWRKTTAIVVNVSPARLANRDSILSSSDDPTRRIDLDVSVSEENSLGRLLLACLTHLVKASLVSRQLSRHHNWITSDHQNLVISSFQRIEPKSPHLTCPSLRLHITTPDSNK